MRSSPIRVSVVIPTYRRAHLVRRSVQSALTQTLDDIEVIVVSDGPDQNLNRVVVSIDDPRLKHIELATRAGANAARNAGVTAAKGAWVALLDDDDEWLPDKLATQLRLAATSSCRLPIVGCRTIMRTPRADVVLPRREPRAGEHISEYMYVRHSPFHGEGLIQTSTIVAPRSLFRLVPFDESLPSLHETDWLLRATTVDGAGLQLTPETLAIWNASEDRPRITRVSGHDLPYAHPTASNEWAWAWARRHRRLFTPRAYAAFLTSVLSYMASVDGEWRLAGPILAEAVRHGSPKGIDLLVFGMIWSIPYGARRWVRDAVLGTWRAAARARRGQSGPAHVGLSSDGDDTRSLTHLRDDGAPV